MASLIGARVARVEDPPLLRGERRYIDDIVVPDVLHAGFVRSPHPHALVRGIDKEAALACQACMRCSPSTISRR